MHIAACLLVLAAVLLLAGCAMPFGLPDCAPARTRTWCCPKLKYDREEREAFAGLRCDW